MPVATDASAALGHAFANPELLARALTHRSASLQNNERLEFLGDALINLIVAELIFEDHPRADEGEMTRLRAALVNGSALAAIAAIYQDAGWNACRDIVRRLFAGRSAAGAGTPKDAKTRLQELLQARALPLPVYELVASSGDEHAKTFEVECRVDTLEIRASGSGSTRRGAEQTAAELVLVAVEAHFDHE